MTTTVDGEIAGGAPTWLLDADFDEVAEFIEALPTPEHRLRVLEWIRAQNDWRRSPGELALRLDSTTIQTPALALIDEAMITLIDSPVPDTGGVRGLIISMPPQEGKSERVSRRGVTWMLQRAPNTRIGLVSYDLDNARRVSLMVRNDIDVFDGSEGNIDLGLRLRKRDRAAARWNLANARGGCYGIGITGSFTGRPIDMLIIDDPVKDYTAADSELISNKTWTWWQSVARPRLAPGAPVVIVLTRWSDLDLAGRLIAKQKEDEESGLKYFDRWTVVNIPAEADHNPGRGETDPLGRAPGEWLVSARGRTSAQWQATKAGTSSPRVWSALYQGHPAPLEGGEIKRYWWKYSTNFPSPDKLGGIEWLMSWDMKLKEKATGDYVVGGAWSRIGSKYYLHEVLRGQWDFPTVRAAIALLAIRYPNCHRHIIENTGNGPEVIAKIKAADDDYTVSDEIAGTLAMTDGERALVQLLLRRGMSGIVPENPKTPKPARMRAHSGLIEAGDVFLPGADEHSAPRWVTVYVDECSAFGVGGSYDDQVDMTSQALKHLSRRTNPDEPALQVPEGRVPPTTPTAAAQQSRAPAPGRIPSPITRQGQIVRRQLSR